jgi:lipopolysaccharide transport system ATP-binding protein
MEFAFRSLEPELNLGFTIYLTNSQGILLFESGVVLTSKKDSVVGSYKVSVGIPPHLLNSDIYSVRIVLGESQRYVLAAFDDLCSFEVEHTSTGRDNNFSKAPGVVRPLLQWNTELLSNS